MESAGSNRTAQWIYAARNDESFVYAIQTSDLTPLLIPASELRSRACFNFITSEPDQIQISKEQTHRAIVRIDGSWQDAATETPLNPQAMSQWLKSLRELEVNGFLDAEAVASLTTAGLEPAQAGIAVWTTRAEQPQRLWVGGPLTEGMGHYGLIESRPGLVQLPEQITEIIEAGLGLKSND